MNYYLSRDVFCCETKGGLVFLDLLRNRYLGLEGCHADTLSSNVQNWTDRNAGSEQVTVGAEPASIALLDRLVVRGILTTTDPGPRTPSGGAVDPQKCFYWDLHDQTKRIPLKQIYRFAAAATRVAIALRLRKFSTIIHRLASSSGQSTQTDLDVRSIALFHRLLRPWLYKSRDACVFDSLVLIEFLRSNGITASLTIGVKTDPFAAHCWVQWGPIVLNNTVEDVTPYSRILVA
jgi:Transglutaminase-like superfamily